MIITDSTEQSQYTYEVLIVTDSTEQPKYSQTEFILVCERNKLGVNLKKKQVYCDGKERSTLHVEVEINVEIFEVMSHFKLLETCSNKEI